MKTKTRRVLKISLLISGFIVYALLLNNFVLTEIVALSSGSVYGLSAYIYYTRSENIF